MESLKSRIYFCQNVTLCGLLFKKKWQKQQTNIYILVKLKWNFWIPFNNSDNKCYNDGIGGKLIVTRRSCLYLLLMFYTLWSCLLCLSEWFSLLWNGFVFTLFVVIWSSCFQLSDVHSLGVVFLFFHSFEDRVLHFLLRIRIVSSRYTPAPLSSRVFVDSRGVYPDSQPRVGKRWTFLQFSSFFYCFSPTYPQFFPRFLPQLGPPRPGGPLATPPVWQATMDLGLRIFLED